MLVRQSRRNIYLLSTRRPCCIEWYTALVVIYYGGDYCCCLQWTSHSLFVHFPMDYCYIVVAPLCFFQDYNV
jgi:hypothetical protein